MMNDRIAWNDDELADGRRRAGLASHGGRLSLQRFGLGRLTGRLPLLAVVVLGLIAAALVGSGVTWLLDGDQDSRQAGGPPPLIKADEQPIKVYPDSPGGMDVPNRDKLVYSRIKGDGEKREVERLLPGPEAPLPPPAALSEPPAAAALAEPTPAPGPGSPASRSPTGNPFPLDAGRGFETAPPIDDDPAVLAAPSLPAEPEAAVKPAPGKAQAERPAAEKATADKRPEKPAGQRPASTAAAEKPAKTAASEKPAAEKPAKTAAAEKPAAEKPAAKPATVEKAAARPAPAAAGGRVYVQLLAARSQDDVLGAWKKLQAKNSDLLGGMAGTVARADLGDRGVFYRLRAGPIASETKAKTLCSALAGRNVSCLIVRPAG